MFSLVLVEPLSKSSLFSYLIITRLNALCLLLAYVAFMAILIVPDAPRRTLDSPYHTQPAATKEEIWWNEAQPTKAEGGRRIGCGKETGT